MIVRKRAVPQPLPDLDSVTITHANHFEVRAFRRPNDATSPIALDTINNRAFCAFDLTVEEAHNLGTALIEMAGQVKHGR